MWCRNCTVTGKTSKDKENVRLTGFDVIRERHNSNSEAPFINSVTGPQEGVLELSSPASPVSEQLIRQTTLNLNYIVIKELSHILKPIVMTSKKNSLLKNM